MTDSVRQDPAAASSVRAENPPTDYTTVRTLAMSLLLVVLIVLLWEGLKTFGRANGYALTVGGTTISLTLFNDTQLPHLGDIFAAFAEPAQRNGPPLAQVLLSASLATFGRAISGFFLGGLLGFALAILFTHSSLMQRGLLPYVVASQTVPILAIAPMVVVWMRQANMSDLAVPVIAAYLTFFPVTIYTLRGLTSVPATSLELMRSYAATPLQVLWKLRLPNALPHIFTALKISATSSVVGAVIGELPSGLQDGLGGAILNFNQYYTQSPPPLSATIVAAAVVGILFFTIIAVTERLVVRWGTQAAE